MPSVSEIFRFPTFVFQLFDWHIQLDKSLPAPLGTIGAWLYRAEVALREEIAIQQVHEETANTIQRKREQHKVKILVGKHLPANQSSVDWRCGLIKMCADLSFPGIHSY